MAAEAALAAGVRRFVHISSMAVHGDRPPLRLDESHAVPAGYRRSATRARSAWRSRRCRTRTRGTAAVSLRPARIYGPFFQHVHGAPADGAADRGAWYSPAMRTRRRTWCTWTTSSSAIARALDAPDAVVGEAFLISEPDQLSWKKFYEFFADGGGSVTSSSDRTRVTRRIQRGGSDGGSSTVPGQIAFSAEVRALAKKVMWTDPYGTWPRRLWDRSPSLATSCALDDGRRRRGRLPGAGATGRPGGDVSASIRRISLPTRRRTVLGYSPALPRADAMDRTLAWARYARLL